MGYPVDYPIYDSNILIRVYSVRLGGMYQCHRFKSYDIDLDMETDADQFTLVFENPNSVYTGLFSKFDKIEIYLNDLSHPLMCGRVDKVTYEWDSNGNTITVVGRDNAAVLIDNDAKPTTRKQVKPASYISERCAAFGLKSSIKCSPETIDELIVNTGESEWAVMESLLSDENYKMWFDFDTICVGEWNTNASPSYNFTRGVGDTGIPIESLSVVEDGTNVKSQINIYGSIKNGKQAIIGTAKNDKLIAQGITKLKTKTLNNTGTASRRTKNALNDVQNSLRDSDEVIITIKTRDNLVKPNRCAVVVDSVSKINASMYIYKVTYKKSLGSGSITEIHMIPDDATKKIIWNGQGSKSNSTGGNGSITGTARLSFKEMIALRK